MTGNGAEGAPAPLSRTSGSSAASPWREKPTVRTRGLLGVAPAEAIARNKRASQVYDDLGRESVASRTGTYV